MCLVLEHEDIKPQVAFEDITCFKLVTKLKDKYVTPYRLSNIMFNILLYSDLYKYQDEVEEGFHSLATLTEALHKYAIRKKLDKDGEHFIWKCIIPKEALYYTSYDNREYASDQIKYVEKVEINY